MYALHMLYMCVYTYICMCMCIYHKKPKGLDPLELESKVFVRCGSSGRAIFTLNQ